MTYADRAYADRAYADDAVAVPLPVGGDPVRDAFRAELEAIMLDAELDYSPSDIVNTDESPEAGGKLIAFEFSGVDEAAASFGSVGANRHEESGQALIRLFAPLGAGHATIEDDARTILNAFRNRRFITREGARVRIGALDVLGPYENETAMWVETVALGYLVINIG